MQVHRSTLQMFSLLIFEGRVTKKRGFDRIIFQSFVVSCSVKMNNFEDFEKKSYQEATKKKYRFKDHASYLYSMLKFFLATFVILIKEIFENTFKNTRPKDLSGQLALITGI